MAIMVQCHKCSTVLELDDGFRGGVCRCNSCGTLLQVPTDVGATTARSRPASPDAAPSNVSRPAAPDRDSVGSGIGSRVQRPAAPGAGSGAFAGSGGASGRPSSPRVEGHPTGSRLTDIPRNVGAKTAVTPPTKRKKRLLGLDPLVFWSLLAVAVLFLVAVGLVIWQIVGNHSTAGHRGTSNSASTGNSGSGSAQAAGPRFLGIPLTGQKIVFSLDGSSANTNSFSYVTQAVQQAVATMASDQEFKVAIWRHKKLTLLPANGWLRQANRKGVRAVMDLLRNKLTYGANNTLKSMTASLALGANQVIFVTAKFQMPPDLTTKVEAVRSAGQRIDVISVDGERRELQKLAQDCDGKFHKYSLSELNDMTSGNE